MRWLVVFDNLKTPRRRPGVGIFPKGRVLRELLRFVTQLEKYAEVEIVVNYDDRFYGTEKPFIREKAISETRIDGIVISMTIGSVNRLIENNAVRNEFLTLLERLKNDAPVIFCTGERCFKTLLATNTLKNFNVIFQRKLGVNWFNRHLVDIVLKEMSLMASTT